LGQIEKDMEAISSQVQQAEDVIGNETIAIEKLKNDTIARPTGGDKKVTDRPVRSPVSVYELACGGGASEVSNCVTAK
jgi:hypothetical protein